MSVHYMKITASFLLINKADFINNVGYSLSQQHNFHSASHLAVKPKANGRGNNDSQIAFLSI